MVEKIIVAVIVLSAFAMLFARVVRTYKSGGCCDCGCKGGSCCNCSNCIEAKPQDIIEIEDVKDA